MATYDDTLWLLSHIHNSFSTSDETGLSETLLHVQWPTKSIPEIREFPFLVPDDEDRAETGDFPRSLDIQTEQSYMGHRFRSDTEHRLEKLKKEKNRQAKITKVQWPTANKAANFTNEEASELFDPKPIVVTSHKSMLTHMLEHNRDLLQNPYLEYAKWDASNDLNMMAKQLRIFVYTGEDVPNYPIEVNVNPAAKVLDVIGLTCFLYTKERNLPALESKPSSYSLHMADEDGTVDWCFTPLQHSSVIDKFGFKILAIAKNEKAAMDSAPQPVTVTVYLSGGVFSLIECESMEITVREVLNRTVAKRREMAKIIETGVQYHLERAEDEPGHPLDFERSLAEIKSLTLHAVRDNSKRAPTSLRETPCNDSGDTPQVFPVTWIKKLAKFDATIELSNSGIFLSVTAGYTGALIRPPHPVSYPPHKLESCTIKNITQSSSNRKQATKLGESKSMRCEVHLTCQGEQRFKDYWFECDKAVGMELVAAIRKFKTEDSLKSKLQDKPRRRYSLGGLKKKAKSNYDRSVLN